MNGIKERIGRILIHGVALSVAGLCAYANSFQGQFILDDPPNILVPPVMINDLSLSTLRALFTDATNVTRPVANFSFALNHLLGGTSLFGYHFVNLSFHVASGLLVFILFSNFLKRELKEPSARWVSFLGALIWVVHPVTPQAVTYIVQRMTVMATFFFLTAFLSYLRAEYSSGWRKGLWWSLTVVSFMLSVLSKENTVILPLLLFCHRVYFGVSGRKGLARLGAGCILMTAASVSLVLILSSLAGKNIGLGLLDYSARNFTVFERLLTQFRVVFKYLGLIVIPTPERLMLDHYVAKSTGLFSPITTFLSISGVLGLLVVCALLFRRHRFPSYCILWFLVSLSLESSFLPLELMFEHRMYLPMLGVIFFLLYWTYHFLSKFSWGMKAGIISVLIVAFLFGTMTYNRNELYHNTFRFWEDNARKAPLKARVINNLGTQYHLKWNLVEAEREYRKAIELDPSNVHANLNIGVIYVDRKEYRKAVETFRKMENMEDLNSSYYYHYGLAHYYLKDFDRAEALFRKSLETSRYAIGPNLFLGKILLDSGDALSALPHFEKEYMNSGDGAQYNFYTGYCYEIMGDYRKARRYYEDALTARGVRYYRATARGRLKRLR